VKFSKTEKMMLKGRYGEACRRSLELIIAIAESCGCEELIKIKSAHVSGVSYKNIGDAGLEYIKDLAEGGAKVRVRTTMNPCGFDLDKPWLFDVDETFFERQLEIIKSLEAMGVQPSLTCTPYYSDNKPRRGDHIAWAESSAVIYANSVIGAYTNRESGPSALAAAITGRAALTKDHINERGPSIAVEVSARISDYSEWSLLGFVVGKLMPDEAPLIKVKMRTRATDDELKCFSAGLGASSATSIFWTAEQGFRELRALRHAIVTSKDLKEARGEWALTRRPTVVFIGCPHCSLREVKEIAEELKGRRVRGDVTFLVSTSRGVYRKASELGLLDVFERAGAHLVKDTCLVVSPMRLSRNDVVLTDSAKTAYYAETMTNATIALGSRRACLEEALEM
jgi:predicted aconitase